ncbi:lysophospholipase A [Legionella beliardensis]|uniref:Lysophospholipase A n=1 Tax=Legionella beliardensis TaxID=91822 RepID=A0A378I6V6_9GAMM|nr:SGNH/GDSL hydrolase family protein [Legionella beliardensis]STX28184.1 lysophospholipase A [Legionella beliardensis]
MKAFVTVCVLVFSTFINASQLNNIVVFGDSLSDNGNLYEHMHHLIPQNPPYYDGRFSNGPVWIEQLVSSYFPNNVASHLSDHAFGGAAIAENSSDDEILFTLNREINTYLLGRQNKADPKSLYVVWIGGNNYLALPENEEHTNTVVTQGIAAGVERLVKAGARHILVLNLPDLGQTPAARALQVEAKLTRLSKHHNELLVKAIHGLKRKYSKVQWLYFDAYKIFNKFLSSAADYGFTNTLNSCYDVSVDKPSINATVLMAAKASKIQDDSCEGYVFFDPVHPTTMAHQLIAQEVHAILDAAHIQFSD